MKEERLDTAPPAPDTQDTASSWEKVEAPLPLPSLRSYSFHTKQISSFPERLELPFLPDEILSGLPFLPDKILSGYEDDVSSGNDLFTMWKKVKLDVF